MVRTGSRAHLVDSDGDFAYEYLKPLREVLVGGCSVPDKPLEFRIPQDMDKICTVLWPCGEVLAEIVVSELRSVCAQGSTILELGCGAALPGLVAATLGAKVIATDMDMTSVESSMAENKDTLATGRGSITTEYLCWGGDAPLPQRTLDVILIADAIYKEALMAPLVTTLAALVRSTPQFPRILFAYQIRDPEIEERFLGHMLPAHGLTYRELPVDKFAHLGKSYLAYVRVIDICAASA